MKAVKQFICHSGGAEGADSYFEFFSKKYRVDVIAYSYKTAFHQSENKYELSESEFREGVANVYKTNEVLKRSRIQSYLKLDRKSTRLNSSHVRISYAVFCLK